MCTKLVSLRNSFKVGVANIQQDLGTNKGRTADGAEGGQIGNFHSSPS